MKTTLKSFAFGCVLLGGVLALSACGDDVTKVYQTTEENSGMEIAKSADDFDDCDSASIGKMMFASDENTAYICADSGWTPLSEKASDGKDGASCTVETLKDSTGYKIMCGEDSVGVVLNGKAGAKGAKGEDGEAGAAGENGTSCAVEMLADSTGYKVVCGEDSVGVIVNGLDGNGCSLKDNGDGTLSQVCGETTVTLYKALCGGNAYDPAKNFCHADSVYTLCDETAYDPAMSFCYADSVYALCGGKAYNPVKEFCSEDSRYSCGGKPFDPSKEFCDVRDSTVYGYVQIGTQTWMTENLNYAYPKLSTSITFPLAENIPSFSTDSISFCYNNDSAYCQKYGRLYTWAAATDSLTTGCGYGVTCEAGDMIQGICPEGWHLPTPANLLSLAFIIPSSDALKSKSGWSDNGNGSDSFGFGALPSGSYNFTKGKFEGSDNTESQAAFYWLFPAYDSKTAYYFSITSTAEYFGATTADKYNILSVRCVKD